MLGYSGHNWTARASTMFGMTTDLAGSPRLIHASAPEYPARLLDLPRPPPGLWVNGRVPGREDRALVIVGSRAASRRSCAAVAALAGELVSAGHAIISGGAFGIDAAAHRGALAAGGRTFAVLGCGIDVVYPDRHAALFREVARSGGLLSEYGPGVAPRPGQFPARNRLVAALGQAVIVAEARWASGALITAGLARRLGRPLLAIPGSAGSDGLLASGAAMAVTSAADVVAALAGRAVAQPAMPATLQTLRRAFVVGEGPATADVLAGRLGLPLGEVLGVLYEAELSGWIVRHPGGRFEVSRGH
jgi:DNA processing protein